MSKYHTIKCVQPFFDEVRSGNKVFEVRLNDRDYKEGEQVTLVLYNSELMQETDIKIHAEIGYVLTDFEGLKEGWCAFSLKYVSTC